MSINKPVIDIEYATNLIGGDRAVVLELIHDFQQEIPSYLEKMNTEYQDENFEQLVGTIHKLSGGAIYAGATSIKQLSKEIEQKYKEQHQFDHDDYSKLLGLLAEAQIFQA